MKIERLEFFTMDARIARNETEREAAKAMLKGLGNKKFALIAIDLGALALFLFKYTITHSDAVRDALDFLKLSQEAFVGAGPIHSGYSVIFESDSCLRTYGRDRPQDPDVETRTLEALCAFLKESGYGA